jgi:hypothetical protein
MSDAKAGDRLRRWWAQVNAAPEPHPMAPGRAAVPYPQLGHRERHNFAECEQYLLREIVDAAGTSRQMSARGDISFTVPWLVQPWSIHNALVEDHRGGGPDRTDMQRIIDWLTDEGALRALTDEQRDELVRSGEAAKARSGWPIGGPGASPEFAAAVAEMYRSWDRGSWEVIPDAMLRVYPHLADVNTDWQSVRPR